MIHFHLMSSLEPKKKVVPLSFQFVMILINCIYQPTLAQESFEFSIGWVR